MSEDLKFKFEVKSIEHIAGAQNGLKVIRMNLDKIYSHDLNKMIIPDSKYYNAEEATFEFSTFDLNPIDDINIRDKYEITIKKL